MGRRPATRMPRPRVGPVPPPGPRSSEAPASAPAEVHELTRRPRRLAVEPPRAETCPRPGRREKVRVATVRLTRPLKTAANPRATVAPAGGVGAMPVRADHDTAIGPAVPSAARRGPARKRKGRAQPSLTPRRTATGATVGAVGAAAVGPPLVRAVAPPAPETDMANIRVNGEMALPRRAVL